MWYRSIIVLLFLFVSAGLSAQEAMSDDESRIISLVLARSHEEHNYIVVSPRTGFFYNDLDDAQEVARLKKYILENLVIDNYDLAGLLDELFERNRRQGRLSLASSPQDGYLIDYNGEYAKYFEHEGGGWERWYREHPQAMGWTSVSRPVHDPKSGIILVYMDTQAHKLAGAGFVIAFKLENGALQELGRVLMWIS